MGVFLSGMRGIAGALAGRSAVRRAANATFQWIPVSIKAGRTLKNSPLQLRARCLSSSAAPDTVAVAAKEITWMEGAQWGLRTEDSDLGSFFERLHSKILARNPPRKADVMRFIMQCESKEDAEKAATLLKSYGPWMPKLDAAGGSLLIRACLRAEEVDLALDVLRAHRQLRSFLSKSVCIDLLVALSKQGRTDEMLDAFSYMRAAQPGVACPKALGVVTAGLGRKGLAAQATQIFLQTRAAGVKPNKFCYRVLLKGCNLAIDDPDSRTSAEQARAKVAKLMADDKIKDAMCDELLAYSPPAPDAAAAADAGVEGGEVQESAGDDAKEPAGAEAADK